MRPVRHWSILILAMAVPVTGMAQTPGQSTVADPLVIGLDPPPAATFADMMLMERTTRTSCGGVGIEPVYAEALPPLLSSQPVRPEGATVPPPDRVYLFSIRADGRTYGIRDQAPETQAGAVDADVQSSLAAWRFAPTARDDCRLTIQVQSRSFADAPPSLLARAFALTGDRAQAPKVRAALSRPGDDCNVPPIVDTAVFPDRAAAAAPPGGRSWAVIRFSVDDQGRTTDLDILDASSDLTAGALQSAIAGTTYRTGEARRGCLHAISRYGAPLHDTPEMPDALASLNRCAPDTLARLTLNRFDYPDAFLNRGIEGWAVVKFDLSSWGEVGGIEVVAAEPAAAFGTAAGRLFRGARVQPAFDHAAGCAQRVTFRLPRDGEASNAE